MHVSGQINHLDSNSKYSSIEIQNYGYLNAKNSRKKGEKPRQISD